ASDWSSDVCSSDLVLGPVVIQSERSVSTTSSISSWPTRGGAKGRNVARCRRVGTGVDTGARAVTSGKALMGRRGSAVAAHVDELRHRHQGYRVVGPVLRDDGAERAPDVVMIARGRDRKQLSQVASQEHAVAVVPLDQPDL